MAVAPYLADTSALARLSQPAVADRLGPLLQRGLVATCSLVDLELLYSTRSHREYTRVAQQRRAFEELAVDQADAARALAVQRELSASGRTRAVGLADLLIAAVAERHRVTLLHYDRDFETVAGVTGQAVHWVVPAGSVP